MSSQDVSLAHAYKYTTTSRSYQALLHIEQHLFGLLHSVFLTRYDDDITVALLRWQLDLCIRLLTDLHQQSTDKIS